jgi:hypothetical protein
MKHKRFFIILFLLLLVPAFSYAALDGPQFLEMGSLFRNIVQVIAGFFMFGWLEGPERVGILQFFLWLTIFIVLYSAGQVVFGRMYGGGEQGQGPANRNAVIVALLFATVTTLLTPPSLLLTLFDTYAAVMIFILFAVPVAGIFYIIYPLFGGLLPNNPGGLRFVRIIGLLLIWWITSLISNYTDDTAGVVTFSNSLPIIIPIAGIIIEKIKNATK